MSTSNPYRSPVNALLGPVRVIQFQERHLRAFLELRRDAEVQRYTSDGPSQLSDEALTQGFVDAIRNPGGLFLIEDVAGGELVGECGLSDGHENYVEVHCILSKNWWRRGIGRLVLDFLVSWAHHYNLTPIGYVDPRNATSIALLQAGGFQEVPNTSPNRNHEGSLAFSKPLPDAVASSAFDA